MQDNKEIRKIKRMILGIAIMIYSLTVSAGDVITNIGFIVVLSGVFLEWFNKLGLTLRDLLVDANTNEQE